MLLVIVWWVDMSSEVSVLLPSDFSKYSIRQLALKFKFYE